MKYYFLKSLRLRLCAFVALVLCGAGMAWGETVTWTHEFASPEEVSNNAITVDGITWNISTTAGAGNPTTSTGTFSQTYGLKFGSSKSIYYGSVTFSTDYFNNYNVKSVKVNILNNGSKSATLTAHQGTTTIGSTTKEFGTAWTDMEVNTQSGSGGVLNFTYSVEQAFYIHSITVVYETDSTPFAGGNMTFDATQDTGTSSLTKGVVTMSCTNGLLDNESEYRFYKNSETTISVQEGYHITQIVFISTAEGQSQYGPGCFSLTNTQPGSYNIDGNRGTWTGRATSITFTASLAQVRATQVVVTVAVTENHIAKFFVNGAELTSAEVQVREDEAITFPTAPDVIGDKHFMGWTIAEIEGEQSTAPATPVNAAIMGTADVNYYAVYATLESGIIGAYTLDYGAETRLQNTTLGYGNAVPYTASDGGTWVIKAYKNLGMQINTGRSCSIKVPECPDKITTIEITGSTPKAVGFSVNDYSGSGTITYLTSGKDNSNQTLTLTSNNVTTGYIVPKSGSISITKIVVKYGSNTYSGYCTTIPNTASFTLSENCYDGEGNARRYYGTYSNSSAFVVPEGLTVHTVSVANGVLAVTDYTSGAIVPANTGVMVSSATAGLKTVNLTTATATVNTEGNMLRPTGSGITAENMAQTGYKFYYLTMNGSQIGFYRRNDTGSAFEMPVANKAYLAVPEGQVGNIKDFSFNDIVDGIKAVETTETESKAIYNLAGQRVSKMQKGIYIVNGKKVLVK